RKVCRGVATVRDRVASCEGALITVEQAHAHFSRLSRRAGECGASLDVVKVDAMRAGGTMASYAGRQGVRRPSAVRVGGADELLGLHPVGLCAGDFRARRAA